MSWESYIISLMGGGVAADAVIVGCKPGTESVWAAYQDGTLKNVTADEIRKLMCCDRQCFFTSGAVIAGMKCTVLRDKLLDEGAMDLRTKPSDNEKETFNMVVAKSKSALIILRAAANVHGGALNDKAFKMSEYLKTCDI